jgi:hypothetical protein
MGIGNPENRWGGHYPTAGAGMANQRWRAKRELRTFAYGNSEIIFHPLGKPCIVAAQSIQALSLWCRFRVFVPRTFRFDSLETFLIVPASRALPKFLLMERK